MSDRIASSSVARRGTHLALALSIALLGGCNYIRPREGLKQPLGVVAVLPIETAAGVPDGQILPESDRVITAQLYGVLAQYPIWRWIPDSRTADELGRLPKQGSLAERAVALGKAVGADSVVYGTVFRYKERIGGPYGASQPASIAFNLNVIAVQTGEVLWSGSFDQTQEALTSNVFNVWQLWQGGPKWFTAQEYAHVAVEYVLEDLKRKVEVTPATAAPAE